MKRLVIALPLLLAAGCATTRPYAPVRDIAYQAIGANPFWTLAIGDDSIVLRTAEGERRWPRVLPRHDGHVRVWHSGEGPGRIMVAASPHRSSDGCRGTGGRIYRDLVIIQTGDGTFGGLGCGGPLLRGRR